MSKRRKNPIKINAKYYEKLAEPFRPNKIGVLFIAESPPERGYFYDYKSIHHNNLFKTIVTASRYCDDFKKEGQLTSEIKKNYLKKLEKENWFLIDSVEDLCIAGMYPYRKKKIIKEKFDTLIKRLDIFFDKKIIDENTKIILICSTVYKALYNKFKKSKFKNNVKNKRQINFPRTPADLENAVAIIKTILRERT